MQNSDNLVQSIDNDDIFKSQDKSRSKSHRRYINNNKNEFKKKSELFYFNFTSYNKNILLKIIYNNF